MDELSGWGGILIGFLLGIVGNWVARLLEGPLINRFSRFSAWRLARNQSKRSEVERLTQLILDDSAVANAIYGKSLIGHISAGVYAIIAFILITISFLTQDQPVKIFGVAAYTFFIGSMMHIRLVRVDVLFESIRKYEIAKGIRKQP